jgi:hypothetical protein
MLVVLRVGGDEEEIRMDTTSRMMGSNRFFLDGLLRQNPPRMK